MYAIAALLRCDGAVDDVALQVTELGVATASDDGVGDPDVGESIRATAAVGVAFSTPVPTPARPQPISDALSNATAIAIDRRRRFG